MTLILNLTFFHLEIVQLIFLYVEYPEEAKLNAKQKLRRAVAKMKGLKCLTIVPPNELDLNSFEIDTDQIELINEESKVENKAHDATIVTKKHKYPVGDYPGSNKSPRDPQVEGLEYGRINQSLVGTKSKPKKNQKVKKTCWQRLIQSICRKKDKHSPKDQDDDDGDDEFTSAAVKNAEKQNARKK